MGELKKWYEIRKGSKITLNNDEEFDSFDGKQIIKKGAYYIEGFRANACCLATTKEKAYLGDYEIVIASGQLTKFNEVDNDGSMPNGW